MSVCVWVVGVGGGGYGAYFRFWPVISQGEGENADAGDDDVVLTTTIMII